MHHVLELEKVNATILIPVNGNNHLLHSLHLPSFRQPKLLQNRLQLPSRYKPVAVLVKHLKRFREIRLVSRGGGRIVVVVVSCSSEERVVEGLVERREVVEVETGVTRLDVGFDGG